MRHFKNIVMGLSVVAAAVVCFSVSLQVGERREQVNALKRQIAADTKAVRRMQAELQIRARPNQLQRLNDAYFGLTAPTADRYFTSADVYVAFAADPAPRSVPQVQPAIERAEDDTSFPRAKLVSFVQPGGAKSAPAAGQLVALTLPAQDVAPRPAASAPVVRTMPASNRQRPAGVHLASYPASNEAAPVRRVEEPRPVAKAPPAEAPHPVAGGLDMATIASIQQAALKEGIQ